MPSRRAAGRRRDPREAAPPCRAVRDYCPLFVDPFEPVVLPDVLPVEEPPIVPPDEPLVAAPPPLEVVE